MLVFGLSVVNVLMGQALFSEGASRAPVSQPRLQQQSNQSKLDAARIRREFEERVPSVDYDSQEPLDAAEKIKRKTKSKHYDGKNLVMTNPSDSGSSTTLDSEVFNSLPALPLAQSDVILTANVLASEAHLSNDKTGVYSEFNVQVEAVLKGTIPGSSQNNLISLSRLGGVVRYPSDTCFSSKLWRIQGIMKS
jgi:hypothetical protein